MRRIMIIVLALVTALGITASTASTATTETGVTASSVKIGGTFPLSGAASLYATIPVAMKAYFSYVNARRGPDGKRGVYGRQIIWDYKDDTYSPRRRCSSRVSSSSRTTSSRWSARSAPRSTSRSGRT